MIIIWNTLSEIRYSKVKFTYFFFTLLMSLLKNLKLHMWLTFHFYWTVWF